MAKTRTVYVCQNCGRTAPREMGRCPDCGEWNTMVESVQDPKAKSHPTAAAVSSRAVRLAEIEGDAWERLPLPVEEFARVLGGGVVPGSIVLIGGDPGIGKCVTEDTRILDPVTGAYLSITDWAKTDRPVLSVDQATLRIAPDKVSAFRKQGTKAILEVKTKLGRRLHCTANHPLLTPNGWARADSLTEGTRIAAPRALPYFGDEQLPESHVKLIAYILSDGSAQSQITVTNYRSEIISELEEIATAFRMRLVSYDKPRTKAKQIRFVSDLEQRVQARHSFAEALRSAHKKAGISWAEWARQADVSYAILNAWRQGQCVPDSETHRRLAAAIDVSPQQLASEKRDLVEARTPIARFLEETGLRYTKAADKVVPDCIFRLRREQVALFLKTLFSCDGSVYVNAHRQPGISYSTISLRLAQDVQHLLLRFGFVATLRTKHSRVNGSKYTAYEIVLLGIPEVQRFLTTIGIIGRQDACEQIMAMEVPQLPSTQRDTVPITETFWQVLREATDNVSFAEMRRRTGTTIRNRRHDRPLTRYVVERIAETYPNPYFDALAKGDIYWDEVTSVVEAGEEPVYDISVSGNANFIANDLIVHNSTLMLQVAGLMAEHAGPALYVSGEESAQQIKMRAERLGIWAEGLFVVTETHLDAIMAHVDDVGPRVLVVDSIQTTYTDDLSSSPGSISQVRESANRLQALAKQTGIAVFVVGHVTKEGSIAGPRVLEHIVDTVLYLEGDAFQAFRLLRSVKNRFGATSEVGVFEMSSGGLVEVSNPSEAFLAERMVDASGSSIAITMEGTRPLLAEVQALASATSFNNPRRTANGVDINRLLLLTAVLQKRAGVRLFDQDIFVNVIGGLKITEPASDLAVAVAIASSARDRAAPADLAIVGEVGLSGELRAVSQLAARLNEAAKLGFRRALVPKTVRPSADPLPGGIEVIQVRALPEALDVALGAER